MANGGRLLQLIVVYKNAVPAMILTAFFPWRELTQGRRRIADLEARPVGIDAELQGLVLSGQVDGLEGRMDALEARFCDSVDSLLGQLRDELAR